MYVSTLSKDTLSLRACNVATPYDIKPPTQVGSTSASARSVRAASTRTYNMEILYAIYTAKENTDY